MSVILPVRLWVYNRIGLAEFPAFSVKLERNLSVTLQGAQGGTPHERLALVALRCLGGMLESRPSFNYSHNIVRLLVPTLDHRRCAEARDIACKSLAVVLRQDKRGDISLEVNTKEFQASIDASTVNMFYIKECYDLVLKSRLNECYISLLLKIHVESQF